jgi:hypothetical protein
MNNLLNGEVKMISESEVRKELAVLKLTVPNSCRAIIALAESYLAVKLPEDPYPEDIFTPIAKEEWPKLHKATEGIGIIFDRVSADIGRRVFNATKEECRLASVVSEDKIKGVIEMECCGKPPYLQENEVKTLAHAIAEYVNGGGK